MTGRTPPASEKKITAGAGPPSGSCRVTSITPSGVVTSTVVTGTGASFYSVLLRNWGQLEHGDLAQMRPDLPRRRVARERPRAARAAALQAVQVAGYRLGRLGRLDQCGLMPLGLLAFHRAPARREQITHPVPAPVRGAHVVAALPLDDGDRPCPRLAGPAA